MVVDDSTGRLVGGLNRRVKLHKADVLEAVGVMEGIKLVFAHGWRALENGDKLQNSYPASTTNSRTSGSWRTQLYNNNIQV